MIISLSLPKSLIIHLIREARKSARRHGGRPNVSRAAADIIAVHKNQTKKDLKT